MTKFKYSFNLFYKFDHLAAYFFAYNDNVYLAQTSLATKKKKP